MGIDVSELKKRLVIVVLNFEAYQETECCVDQILAYHMGIAGIIIVDNDSKNESVAYLRKKYNRNKKIKIVKSNRNRGFAKGNNLGIKIAREKWQAEYILLLNSDTLMLQEDYIEKLFSVYDEGVAVIQSNALRTNGRLTSRSYDAYTLKALLCELFNLICDTYDVYSPWHNQKAYEIGPHISGCDIMLTPYYFEKFNGLYPLTFLFIEEHILKILIKKAGLTSRIAEEACLLHKESMSTPMNLRIGSKVRRKAECVGKLHAVLVKIFPIWLLQRIINRGEW